MDGGWRARSSLGEPISKPHRQFIYSEDGKVATDAHYAEYKDFNGFSFPSRIEIYRPRGGVRHHAEHAEGGNQPPLKDDQFVLAQPPGAVVVRLDSPQSSLVDPLRTAVASNRQSKSSPAARMREDGRLLTELLPYDEQNGGCQSGAPADAVADHHQRDCA